MLVIPIFESPIIFAGGPSGNIITHNCNNQMPKAFSAHTDTDKVFGQAAPGNNKKYMKDKELRELYKDIILMARLQVD